jgi:hypothetical protein
MEDDVLSSISEKGNRRSGLVTGPNYVDHRHKNKKEGGTKHVPLSNTPLASKTCFPSVLGEHNNNVFVDGSETVDKNVGAAKTELHIPQETTIHGVKGFDEVNENRPRFLVMFLAFFEEEAHSQNGIPAATTASKTTLGLNVQVPNERFKPGADDNQNNLLGDLCQHDGVAVPGICRIPLLKEHRTFLFLPSRRHSLRHPKLLHHRCCAIIKKVVVAQKRLHHAGLNAIDPPCGVLQTTHCNVNFAGGREGVHERTGTARGELRQHALVHGSLRVENSA